jgi:hypothetical protein
MTGVANKTTCTKSASRPYITASPFNGHRGDLDITNSSLSQYKPVGATGVNLERNPG